MPTRSRWFHREAAHRPFSQRPVRDQREAFVRLRWLIRQRAGAGSDLRFSTDHLDEPGRPALWRQHLDAMILSQDGRTVWNATVITVQEAFWNALEELAWQETKAQLTPEETAREQEYYAPGRFRSYAKPCPGHPNLRIWDIPEPPRHASLNGMTVPEAQKVQQRVIAAERPPEVFEEWSMDREYAYGIGLHVTLDAATADTASVSAFIDRFRAGGEQPYRAAQPAGLHFPALSRDDLLPHGEAWAASSFPVRL